MKNIVLIGKGLAFGLVLYLLSEHAQLDGPADAYLSCVASFWLGSNLRHLV